jgi:hypothetical protein
MEYRNSRNRTRGVDPWFNASVEMAPRTGPMQGVQPTAKAIPSGKAPVVPGLTRDRNGRPSR